MIPRRSPVQRDCHLWPGRYGCTHTADSPEHHAGTVSWEEHVRAWEDYAKHYSGQSAGRIAERGGFGYAEIAHHLGASPSTWERS